jgi:hypothetical protein
MDLLGIRQWFVRESGRYDLVVDAAGGDWADNGANSYINAGIRMLDRMQDTSKSIARNFQLTASGTNILVFQNCRAIREVWCADTESRWKLDKKDMQWMRENYADPDSDSYGTPLYYTPAALRNTPLVDLKDAEDYPEYVSYLKFLDISYTSTGYNGVLLGPPADGEYLIEVWGVFRPEELATDTATNEWTVRWPEIVVMASQAMLEKFNRNTEGLNDWLAAISSELRTIDIDEADEESAEILRAGDNV